MFANKHHPHHRRRYTHLMSLAQQMIQELSLAHERFHRSTQLLTEATSSFTPAPGMMTTAQQVAHAAQVIDWFMEGAFRTQGFDLDFDPQIQKVLAVQSLAAARTWLDKSVGAATALLSTKTDEELTSLLPNGPVLGGMPRKEIINAITDHTAHHRGALSVYARLNNITPPDPYTSES